MQLFEIDLPIGGKTNSEKAEGNRFLFIQWKVLGTKPLKMLIFICAFLALLPAFAANKTAWKMVQREKSAGIIEILFCSNGVKIVDKNRGFTIVSTAPSWDVYFFRADDKTLCRLTRQQYYNKNAFKSKRGGTPSRILGMVKIGSFAVPMYYDPYHNDAVKRFEGVPVQVEDLISCYYKANAVDGIVLKSVSNFVQQKPTSASAFLPADLNPTGVVRETISLKEVPCTDTDFKIPSGFRAVSELNQIITGALKRKEAESIFLEMGVGDELGKRKGK